MKYLIIMLIFSVLTGCGKEKSADFKVIVTFCSGVKKTVTLKKADENDLKIEDGYIRKWNGLNNVCRVEKLVYNY